MAIFKVEVEDNLRTHIEEFLAILHRSRSQRSAIALCTYGSRTIKNVQEMSIEEQRQVETAMSDGTTLRDLACSYSKPSKRPRLIAFYPNLGDGGAKASFAG